MSDVVVDSSVATKWVLPEADSPLAQRVMTEVTSAGDSLIILDLALVEITNAIWKQYAQGIATEAEARHFLSQLRNCPIHAEPADRLLEPALELAIKYRAAVYDALFVALANDLGLRGVTADTKLHHAVHADFPNIILLSDW